ncbi:unnamed protein product, partial [marine sediment metagenome]
MTENPGQQFTGSFHPITEGDWVKPEYENRDHLGRNNVLLMVKSGECCNMSNEQFQNFLVNEVYDKKNWDSSLFTFVEYYLMYGYNHEHLLQVWNDRDRIPKAKINLYWFQDPLVLAILCNRSQLINYVYQKPSYDYKNKNLLQESLIPAAIYCDNVDICKILVTRGIGCEDPAEIEQYIYKYRQLINHCRANRIAKLYGINMKVKKKSSFSYAYHCKEEKIENEHELIASLMTNNNCIILINNLLKDPTFFESVSENTLSIIFKIWTEKKGDTIHVEDFIGAVVDQLVRKFECANANIIGTLTFNDWWYIIITRRIEENYKNNSTKASFVCLEFLAKVIRNIQNNKKMSVDNLGIPKDLYASLKELSEQSDFGVKEDLMSANGTITSAIDPSEKITAHELFILKLFFDGYDRNDKFTTLQKMLKTKKVKINIWVDGSDLFRRALFDIDSPVLLNLLVKKESC